MGKLIRLALTLALVCTLILSVTAVSAADMITVGIVNNPPSESGYREANVKDMEKVFSAENGYSAKTFYSIKNDEQLNAAQQFITEGTIDHQFAEVLKQYRIVQGKKGQYAQIAPSLRKAGEWPDNVGGGSDGENDRAVFRLIQPGNGRKRANQGTGSFRIIFGDERLKQ